MKHPMHFKRWIIWGLAVAFYFYEYFLRVAPSVMINELLDAFQIGAGILGTITAFYFYAYAPMQLPVGILMDRYGARTLLTFATLLCGIATLLFGFSSQIWLASFARLLIGGGSAFAFVGMIYISSHWFSGKTLALLVGIGNSIGMLGAVFGEGPLSLLVQAISWRQSMYLLGTTGIILGIIIFLLVRNDPPSKEKHETTVPTKEPLFKNFTIIIKNPQTWINGIVALCFYTVTVAFAGLWAIPFFKHVHQMSNNEASFAASMIYIGWIIAGPIIGHFSDKNCDRKLLLIIFTFLSIIFFLAITYILTLSHLMIFILMLMLGICLSSQLLCYSLAIELNPYEAKGISLALTNFLVFVGGSIIQTLVGWLLDFNWKGAISLQDGSPIYTVETFQKALLCFPISILLAFIFSFFIKEKPKSWCQ